MPQTTGGSAPTAGKHVAIVSHAIAASLISGRKRIESRLSRNRRAPVGRIRPGDLIYFKLTGGHIIGLSFAERVLEIVGLCPATIRSLHRAYGRFVAAPPDYWRARRAARYAVLVWLSPFVPLRGPIAVPRQYGSGWIVLDPGG